VRYEDIANRLSIPYCSGPCDWGDQLRHEKGGVHNGTVHWRRERFTRPGLYDFLKVCSRAVKPVRDLPVYEQIWVHSTYATRKARELGIVVPSMVTRHDRLRVRTLLPPEIPSSNIIYRWTHKETV
jgi:hypothetical protein